jgi:hypothetical protein
MLTYHVYTRQEQHGAHGHGQGLENFNLVRGDEPRGWGEGGGRGGKRDTGEREMKANLQPSNVSASDSDTRDGMEPHLPPQRLPHDLSSLDPI